MNYNHRYRMKPRRRSIFSVDYLIPFLIVICLGVIGVLGYNLWDSLYDSKPYREAVLNIVDGNVQMRTWGTDRFFNIDSGAYLMHGDEIKTSAGANVIIEFFDGTIMRVGEDSSIIFEEIGSKDSVSNLVVRVNSGRAWFNKVFRNVSGLLIVKTDYVDFVSSGKTVFSLMNEGYPYLAVLGGDYVSMDVLNRTGENVVETEKISLGQEVMFSDVVFSKYWNYQSPNVLSVLNDEFKQSDWYLWNVAEDSNPSYVDKDMFEGSESFLRFVEPEIVEEIDDLIDVGEQYDLEGSGLNELEQIGENVDIVTLSKPELVSVSGALSVSPNEDGFFVVKNHLATINGKVQGADKIMVNDYVLQEFSTGDMFWVYYANVNYGFMKEGENVYEIYALDSNDNKSDPLVVKILYEPVRSVDEEVADELEEAVESPTGEEENAVEDESDFEDFESSPPDWLL